SPAGTPRTEAGVLGAPGAAVLFGDQDVDDDVRSGLRVRLGFWLDECQTCGLEGSFLYVGREAEANTFACNPSCPIVARPFFNAAPATPTAQLVTVPRPDSELVCLPGILNGTVTVDTVTEFYGFDANFRKNL